METSQFLVAIGSSCQLFDTTNTKLNECHQLPFQFKAIAWSPDNKFLAAVDKSGIHIVDRTSFKSKLIGSSNPISDIAIDAKAGIYVAGKGLWRIKLGEQNFTQLSSQQNISRFAINFDSSTLVFVTNDGVLNILDLKNPLNESVSLRTNLRITSIQFSHFKKSILAVGDENGSVHLFDVAQAVNTPIHTFPNTHQSACSALTFSPHNRYLLCSGGLDGRFVLIDVEKKVTVKTVLCGASPVTSIAFKSDGVTLAVGGENGFITIFDLRAGSKPLVNQQISQLPIIGLKFANRIVVKSTVIGTPQVSSSPAVTVAPSTPQVSNVKNSERHSVQFSPAVVISEDNSATPKASNGSVNQPPKSILKTALNTPTVSSSLSNNSSLKSLTNEKDQDNQKERENNPRLSMDKESLTTAGNASQESLNLSSNLFKSASASAENLVVPDSNSLNKKESVDFHSHFPSSNSLKSQAQAKRMSTTAADSASSGLSPMEDIKQNLNNQKKLLADDHLSPKDPMGNLTLNSQTMTLTPMSAASTPTVILQPNQQCSVNNEVQDMLKELKQQFDSYSLNNSKFIEDTMNKQMLELQMSVRQDLQNIHVEILKQFYNQSCEMKQLFEDYKQSQERVRELLEENERLRKMFE